MFPSNIGKKQYRNKLPNELQSKRPLVKTSPKIGHNVPMVKYIGQNVPKMNFYSTFCEILRIMWVVVVVFVFNILPTAKVIWRPGHALKSHPTDW